VDEELVSLQSQSDWLQNLSIRDSGVYLSGRTPMFERVDLRGGGHVVFLGGIVYGVFTFLFSKKICEPSNKVLSIYSDVHFQKQHPGGRFLPTAHHYTPQSNGAIAGESGETAHKRMVRKT